MLPLVNDLVPKNDIAKTSHRLPSMTIQISHTHPFTSNDEAYYQINGKVATSKGGGKRTSKTFRVGRFAPSCSLAHNKNILYTNTLILKHF